MEHLEHGDDLSHLGHREKAVEADHLDRHLVLAECGHNRGEVRAHPSQDRDLRRRCAGSDLLDDTIGDPGDLLGVGQVQRDPEAARRLGSPCRRGLRRHQRRDLRMQRAQR